MQALQRNCQFAGRAHGSTLAVHHRQPRGHMQPRLAQHSRPRSPPPAAVVELASVCEAAQNFQIPAAAAVVLPVMGLAGYKLSLYSQKEVINARMIGNFVPENSRNFIQMCGTTRDIFYYPKSTTQIAVYGNNAGGGLFEQAGMQAQIPVVSFKKNPSSLDAVPNSSIDAIACLGGITDCDARLKKRLLQESVRVLKPNAPFIFIEPLADGGSPVRGLVAGNRSNALATSEMEDLLSEVQGLEVVQVDVALDGQDPHAVGYARKSTAAQAKEGLSRAERRQLERQLMKKSRSPLPASVGESKS